MNRIVNHEKSISCFVLFFAFWFIPTLARTLPTDHSDTQNRFEHESMDTKYALI